MKGQRWAVGSIVKIPLDGATFSYGQLLEKGNIAIFNIETQKECELQDVIKLKVLFIVAIYSYVIPSGRWTKLGKENLNDSLKKLPLQFIQDVLNPEKFELYEPHTGKISKARKEECLSLECCAVWAAEHVESRIIDQQ